MTLPVGTAAPAFTAKDTNGNTVKLSDFAGKILVLYFYPKDDTPGCTKEACSFRDSWSAYLNKGIAVVGVSRDDETSHKKFTEKYQLPFPLLADVDGAITRAYDVVKGDKAKRVTYVIDRIGRIAQVYEGDTLNPETHAQDILNNLKVL
ncbi:MAG: peroxiredoxin [Oscillatoriaceae bacterium SKW80]|nr:peroxiredoxin [Oscillatoriaceae bacterium SKYG93]MCX8121364.1 peroxiredoxin [Oscillatoriaceae bacterium SKW80]MDW8451960.1 peroxiredoxin [Oscillatoriaceae cyanobacterium SKYGB_i_bin93]HIK29501.1 peroxiredoxin [Oscillatoriaceae cyanobacterium M7585_C2015_266]